MTRKLVLESAAVQKGSLILVNSNHPIAPEYTPTLTAADSAQPAVLLDHTAAVMYRQILADIYAGGAIAPVSGYRSFAEQTEIYEQSLAEKGEDFTRNYVALPGCSEHQTGLAIDVALAARDIDFIRPSFPNDGICALFRKRAARYGFIERYGRGKQEITGIAHEPWHFRYVGFPHAEILCAHNLCLEEYIEFVKQFDEARPLCYYHNQSRIDVSFVPCEQGRTVLTLPEHDVFQISGNNVDGFIVTQWRRAYAAA